jgi:hypothetical protein
MNAAFEVLAISPNDDSTPTMGGQQ